MAKEVVKRLVEGGHIEESGRRGGASRAAADMEELTSKTVSRRSGELLIVHQDEMRPRGFLPEMYKKGNQQLARDRKG